MRSHGVGDHRMPALPLGATMGDTRNSAIASQSGSSGAHVIVAGHAVSESRETNVPTSAWSPMPAENCGENSYAAHRPTIESSEPSSEMFEYRCGGVRPYIEFCASGSGNEVSTAFGAKIPAANMK